MNNLAKVSTKDLVAEYKKRRKEILDIRLKELNELLREMKELEIPILNGDDYDYMIKGFEIREDCGREVIVFEEIHSC